MRLSDIPTKLAKAFGYAAGGAYIRQIPEASQIGVVDGAASLADGFPPLTATLKAAGGIPPDIKDMNGILNEISAWAVWVAAGGTIQYDAAFSAAIGGYPAGAILQSASFPGLLFASTADNNVTNPEAAGAADWRLIMPVAATQDEVNAGTNTTDFVTPATLAGLTSGDTPGVVSLTNPGFRSNLDGSIEQWGVVQSGNAAGSVYNFPVPFPNTCLSIMASPAVNDGGSTNGNSIFITPVSPAQFRIGSDERARASNWRAIGF